MSRPTAVPPFPAIDAAGRYSAELAALRGLDLSGVYAVLDLASFAAGESLVLYVGESHTGRLYDTITRHFRAWKRPDGTRRTGGHHYDRRRVVLTHTVMPADEVPAAQYAEILRLAPRDNVVDGSAARTETTAAALRQAADVLADPFDDQAPF